MISQAEDLAYGYEREKMNHRKIEELLGVKLRKNGKFDTMDWTEDWVEEGDESPRWQVEQKARKMTYDFLKSNYKSPKIRYPSALIGKNKIDYMLNNGENGIVVFDFTDCIMYWQFDAEEYKKMEIEQKFVRGARTGYIDKPHPVVHIPCELLKKL